MGSLVSSFNTDFTSTSSERRAVILPGRFLTMNPYALAVFLLVIECGVSALKSRPSRYKLISTYDATNFLQSFDMIDVR